jgi:hypothetical protein
MAASLLRKRLAKVRQQVTEKSRREKLANCNCQLVTVVLPNGAEKFEAEMNLQCPSHGFRTLGRILSLRPYKSTFRPDASDRSDETWDRCQKDILEDDATKIDALIDLYIERYRQHARREAEEDSDEF